jgi:transcription antitermination factor NusG
LYAGFTRPQEWRVKLTSNACFAQLRAEALFVHRHISSQERLMNSLPWHVLHVLTNHEKRVAQHLDVRAVQHYLPLYSERIKWTDRSVVAERPLFSGYVFVRSFPQNRLSIISIPGVIHLLGNNEWDLVSNAELDKIRDGLSSGLLLRPHPCVCVGTRVRVRGGVFAGVEGMVTELRRQCKVIIALSAVRQCFSLETDLSDLEVLSKPLPKSRLEAIPVAYSY